MSEVEKLEAEIRILAAKVIYAGFENGADPADQEKLERLSEKLIRLNAVGSSIVDEPAAA